MNGYYPDFSNGVIIGLLLGVVGPSILCLALWLKLRASRHSTSYGVDPLAAAWTAHTREREHR